MGHRHDHFDFVAYSFGVKLLQPEQASRAVFDKVIATDLIGILGTDLQDKFNFVWQCDIFGQSLIVEICQKLIGRFRDDQEFFSVIQVCIGIDPLLESQNVVAVD
jgi:hypothetical protein